MLIMLKSPQDASEGTGHLCRTHVNIYVRNTALTHAGHFSLCALSGESFLVTGKFKTLEF